MLTVSSSAAAFVPADAGHLLMTVNLGLGFVLLIWYVRE